MRVLDILAPRVAKPFLEPVQIVRGPLQLFRDFHKVSSAHWLYLQAIPQALTSGDLLTVQFVRVIPLRPYRMCYSVPGLF